MIRSDRVRSVREERSRSQVFECKDEGIWALETSRLKWWIDVNGDVNWLKIIIGKKRKCLSLITSCTHCWSKILILASIRIAFSGFLSHTHLWHGVRVYCVVWMGIWWEFSLSSSCFCWQVAPLEEATAISISQPLEAWGYEVISLVACVWVDFISGMDRIVTHRLSSSHLQKLLCLCIRSQIPLVMWLACQMPGFLLISGSNLLMIWKRQYICHHRCRNPVFVPIMFTCL
jgi:hypothetical protein